MYFMYDPDDPEDVMIQKYCKTCHSLLIIRKDQENCTMCSRYTYIIQQ